jgi:Fic family protein
MEDYFLFYEQNLGRLHPVLLAAEMHERLVTIHPFIDGNGRTARLVMNLILWQHGYTTVNIKGGKKSRLAYYNALEKVSRDDYIYFITLNSRKILQRIFKIGEFRIQRS